jgi:4-hydroxyacetophenone monooxygenase
MATKIIPTDLPQEGTVGHDEKIAHVQVHSINNYDVDEQFIRSAVNQADAGALRIALCQITDDQELKAMRVTKIDILGGAVIDYALSKEDQAVVRKKALAYLLSGPHEIPPPPSREEASRLMDLYSDTPMRDDENMSFDYDEGYEELAFEQYPRELGWTGGVPPPASELNNWNVIVIGAGICGIAAGQSLKKLGIPFEIIERQGAVGGTWMQNTYPHVRVDSPAFLFSYRFTKNYKWKQHFPAGADIRQYLEDVATDQGLMEHMRFNSEVVAAKWDEGASKWNYTIRHTDGTEKEMTCNIIISASGLFSTPKLPDIKGIDSFKGPIFHTSRWDHDVDYKGKRVALIGTGSTGTQLAPALAETAAHLTVYQRTANWVIPFEFFRMPITDNIHWMCEHMPFYWNWYCFTSGFKTFNFFTLQSFDKDWIAKGGAISERNDNVRKALTGFIRESLSGRPDLVAKMLPTHAPGVRRNVVDNGFYQTVQRPNVSLITEGIDCITETGIRTRDGGETTVDMIALGAGFQVSQYFWPVDYLGTEGMTLQKAWEKDGARSYLGMAMPNYPNLFTFYGPNHQPRAGSLHSFAEKWARYTAASIVGMIERGKQSMEVKKEVYDEYNVRLDAATKKHIWESEGSGYYVNKHGRQGVNMPWTNAEYHTMIVEPNFDDFHLK